MCKPTKPYTSNFRKFAITVRHYSGKRGYGYIRDQFDKHMPALSTIKAWQAVSDSNAEPGFSKQTTISLKELALSEPENYPLYVSLSFDEIFIRRRIEYSNHRFTGLVTYGKRDNQDCFIANNAIFFRVTCIKTGHSLILGYFFIQTLNANEKKT